MESERIVTETKPMTWKCSTCHQSFPNTVIKGYSPLGADVCKFCDSFMTKNQSNQYTLFVQSNEEKYGFIRQRLNTAKTEEDYTWFIWARDKFLHKFHVWCESEEQKSIKEIEDW